MKPVAAIMSWHGNVGSASAISIKPMAKRPSQKIRKSLVDLTKALHRLEAPSMVIGGIAVIAHGVARQTIDIEPPGLPPRLEASQILATLEAGSAPTTPFPLVRLPLRGGRYTSATGRRRAV